MSPSELAYLFEQNPTQPYRIILNSGDHVVVADPRKTIISEMVLFLRRSEDLDKPYGKVAIIGIPNISMVEPIERPLPPRRSRRK